MSYLVQEFLITIAACDSVSSAIEVSKRKEDEIRRSLEDAGFDMSASLYLLRKQADVFAEKDLADMWQFALDLNTIKDALQGNWIGHDSEWSYPYNEPEYYEDLKREIFEIRHNLLYKVEFEESKRKIGIVYQEIKDALLKRNEPVIECRYHIYKEKFVIKFKNETSDNISLAERARIAMLRKNDLGDDTWLISYGADTQNMKVLVCDDVFQHSELRKMVSLLRLPF